MSSVADFSHVKPLLLDMARERDAARMLDLVVQRLASGVNIGRVEAWLVRAGDLCATCDLASACPERDRCLHRVAQTSAVGPIGAGRGERVPLGHGELGRIGASGEPVVLRDLQDVDGWFEQHAWARFAGLRGFAGQPLLSRGEVLGVLCVYTTVPVAEEGPGWLRIIADHAAVALTNARAFEEIELLRKKLELENAYLRSELTQAHPAGNLGIGGSPAWCTAQAALEQVAPTDATVLILGESGTGKELAARTVHERSLRRKGPLIKVNCASIPRELYESEFFGHVKGSFTGAVRDQVGRFQLADGGTLFLDEVGEIPLELQAKLLRALQEGTFERIGEGRTVKVDVRIVAATNRNLEQAARDGTFREDLYYRLSVFPVEVPPLRERVADIVPLARYFLETIGRRMGRTDLELSAACVAALEGYAWPGNVRELQNVIERSIIISPAGKLRIHLPQSEHSGEHDCAEGAASPAGHSGRVRTDEEMQRLQVENLLTALELTDWKIHGSDGAAALLQMRPTTLASRIRRLGLQRGAESSAHRATRREETLG